MRKELDVSAAVIIEKGKFLLCQRKAGDRYGLLWEFPGGVIEEEESPSLAIEREIEEELGIEISAEELIDEFFDEDEQLKIRIFLFRCEIKGGKPYAKDCHDFGFFTFEEVERLDLTPADKKIATYLKESFPR